MPHNKSDVQLGDQWFTLPTNTKESEHKLYKNWKKCMVNKMSTFRGKYEETWKNIGSAVGACEEPYATLFKVGNYRNKDEIKRHIMPIKETDREVIVTLGIGHDTRAEEKYLKAVKNRSVDFFGADPMVEINEELFSKFGNFYPFAIGAKSETSAASILEKGIYHPKKVVKLDIIYFLTQLIGLKHFDDLWIDCEGAEYEFAPFLLKGGEFDKNNITVCQFNIEFHKPNLEQKKKIHDFIFKTLDDGRYAMFRMVMVGHMRAYFVNFENKTCLEKYIPDFTSFMESTNM